MTEAEWHEAVDPRPMLRASDGRIGTRELLQFAHSCCDRVRSLLRDPRSVHALAVLQRTLIGQTDSGEVATSIEDAQQAVWVAVRAFCVPVFGEEEFNQQIRTMRSGPDPLELMASVDPEYLAAEAAKCALCCVSDSSMAVAVSRYAAEAIARSGADVEEARLHEWANQAILLRQIVDAADTRCAEQRHAAPRTSIDVSD